MSLDYEIPVKGAALGIFVMIAVLFFPGQVEKWLAKRQAKPSTKVQHD